jgi:hypothetical protein
MRVSFWPFGIVAVFVFSMLYAADWIRTQEKVFRLAEVERTLRAAGSHAA